VQKLKNEELGRPDLIAYQQIKKLPIIIVLDNVRSALNVGSVFRSSDAFRVEKIILCGITAQPPHKEVLKTAIGATESVQWEYFEDTKEAVKQLKSEQVMVYAIEQASNSIDLREFIPAERTAVIFGHEMDGVAQDVINLCDGCIEIHQEGTKHSLNVSVCAGIICWELHKKMTSL
jgi:23S rRNA (guanosine2251-2'-O)-methyltransferase